MVQGYIAYTMSKVDSFLEVERRETIKYLKQKLEQLKHLESVALKNVPFPTASPSETTNSLHKSIDQCTQTELTTTSFVDQSIQTTDLKDTMITDLQTTIINLQDKVDNHVEFEQHYNVIQSLILFKNNSN